ncbi:MAG: large-conductance mechanosensitive channel protein MscL [Bacteroidota bacterium]
MLKEFKEFAFKGNMIDMAVGIIIGGAFGTIVQSLVNDIIMPPIGLVLGNMDFRDLFVVLRSGTGPEPYANLAAAKSAGAVTFNYGMFINNLVAFLIVAFSVFMLIKMLKSLETLSNGKAKQEAAAKTEPVVKQCPYCLSTIDIKATRCAYCTSELTR